MDICISGWYSILDLDLKVKSDWRKCINLRKYSTLHQGTHKIRFSSLHTMFKLSKTPSPQKLFDYDCVTLHFQLKIIKQIFLDSLALATKLFFADWTFPQKALTLLSVLTDNDCSGHFLRLFLSLHWSRVSKSSYMAAQAIKHLSGQQRA